MMHIEPRGIDGRRFDLASMSAGRQLDRRDENGSK
jgi:hypothetical protein